MDIIYNILPKDLALIVESYAKDRTNYDKVLKNLRSMFEEMNYCIKNNFYGECVIFSCYNVVALKNNTIYTRSVYLKRRHWKAWLLLHKRQVIDNIPYHNNVCKILNKLLININSCAK